MSEVIVREGPASVTVTQGSEAVEVAQGSETVQLNGGTPGPEGPQGEQGPQGEPAPQAITGADGLEPAAAVASTMRRHEAETNVQGQASGTLRLTPLYIEAGTVCNSITFAKGSNGVTTPANQWFALYTTDLALLRQTVDDTTTAWGNNTTKTLALTSSLTISESGVYLVGILVAATAVGNFRGTDPHPGLNGLSPVLTGTSTTGLTGTAPNPAAAITATAGFLYAHVA